MPRPALLLAFVAWACSQQPTETRRPTTAPETAAEVPPQAAPTGSAVTETFETAEKGAYAPGEEKLPSGPWGFDDALIGASAQDHKNGQRAARLRNQGRLRMNFDAPAGVRTVRISSAPYGDDAPGTWELWASYDGGRRYQRLGSPVTARGARLAVSTFACSGAPLRLEIRKTSSAGRLNLDDITFETGGSSGASGTASPVPAAATPPTQPPTSGPGTRGDNLALGNPSGATSDPANASNYLLIRPQYVVGYNALRGTPTWVSWHLSRAWLGTAPRQDDFRPDPALPRQFYQVTPRSYAGSGFDRGHNCPSADRSADLDDNSATFLMTNMIPQAGPNNQRTWSGLEEWARQQVQRGQEVYVVMGSYGKGGTGTAGPKTTLDNGRVTVPARVWKLLVVLPEGDNDLQRIAAGQARILAVDTPNDMQVSPDWSRYRVSVDALETATGLDLLSKLPPDAQTRLQAQVDAGPTK